VVTETWLSDKEVELENGRSQVQHWATTFIQNKKKEKKGKKTNK